MKRKMDALSRHLILELFDCNLDVINDPEKVKTQGAVGIATFDEAWRWNEKKWGVFWTVNEFDGPRRKENLKRILAWTAELDGGDKPAMMKKIMKFLKPWPL